MDSSHDRVGGDRKSRGILVLDARHGSFRSSVLRNIRRRRLKPPFPPRFGGFCSLSVCVFIDRSVGDAGLGLFPFVSDPNPILSSVELMNFAEMLEHHILDHRLATLFTVGHTTIYLTLHGLMMWIAGLVLLIGLLVARTQEKGVATGLANLFEVFIVY